MARGGKREGSGRPVGTTIENAKSESVQIRLTKEQKQALKQMAEESGMTVSELIISKVFN